MLTSIHVLNHSTFCIQTHCVQPLICLCPCKCTHFEPLCIRANIHKYTSIVWWTLLYKNLWCRYIWLCPCERSQLEPLCLHASAHKYTFFRSQHLLYTNPLRANSHMSVPSRVLTLRTSFDTCNCLQIFIYRVMDTFVPEPTVRKLTYGCTLASAHS